jgi:hypothetical protein
MKLITIDVDIVEIYDRATHTARVIHIWNGIGGDHLVEWWMSADGQHHAVYWPDAFYNDQLRQRHETRNMICPQDKSQRLVFIGMLSGDVGLAPESYFEIMRNRITLQNVAENE